MRPFLAPDDFMNGAFVDAVFRRESFRSGAAIRVALSDLANICLGQSGVVSVFSMRRIIGTNSCLSAFANFIRRIIGVRPKKEVIRANTGPVIAMVADELTVRDWAEVQLPREPMSDDVFSINLKSSVTKTRVGPLISPAARGLLHVSPEPFFRQSKAPDSSTSETTETSSAGSDVARIRVIFFPAVQAIRCWCHNHHLTQIATAPQGWATA